MNSNAPRAPSWPDRDFLLRLVSTPMAINLKFPGHKPANRIADRSHAIRVIQMPSAATGIPNPTRRLHRF